MNLPSIEEIQEVIQVAELARRAGFGRRTLYAWLEKGDVPGNGLAKEYRIKAVREALETARAEKAATAPLTREGGGVGGRAAGFPRAPAGEDRG